MTDFSQFDSRGGADEARPLHILHPADGTPIFDGDAPCRVLVRGVESPASQAVLREVDADPLPENASEEQLHDRAVSRAVRLIAGFENVERAGRAATAADADWFLNLNMMRLADRGRGASFVEQVLRFAGERANFLGKSQAAS